MPRVVHFEISADEVGQAIDFYSGVFGWKIEKWGGPIDYWLITTGREHEPGIDGGLRIREKPSDTTINTIDVPSVAEYSAKITAHGGKIIQPKTVIPGVGYFAYCQDTEGNTFGIMEADESAK